MSIPETIPLWLAIVIGVPVWLAIYGLTTVILNLLFGRIGQ